MHNTIKAFFLLSGAICSLGAAASENALDAQCTTRGQIAMRLMISSHGSASINVMEDKTTHICAMELEEIEGPPLSRSNDGGLQVEALVTNCTPAMREGSYLKEVFLRIYDQQSEHPSAYLMFRRAEGPARCTVERINTSTLETLHRDLEK
ncbi:MAG: hypothetical protein B0D96_03630 [Candidatus Sedimenticola endophacoides]|uniref:DUF3019 domain-containing protein n=1 Tax=Candidatus Sedimenticola endophacoides TaxID=2548426 RepID=A0A657Q7E2_9GAMM|nr:MAG: hypothetical protein B0D94_03465 [Candidatus Sedimenticola endophacoides]OQX35179.1 MAG: hypothetical protein B0D84_02665 [Candidatus Sedimenticola endophacoides]OQX36686.1 MAG: hypothetical protein B0D96_03630 [Candidatus Sedimenticola endophacoides]OQX41685.1 MAG: hypothetical protein B0D89_03320 [Candidatus Sedimenticola endophacoides]OQX46464.1 MAG: hypothetical protein B0D90_01090 [Candidatus Sedimenticola endophacoides]